MTFDSHSPSSEVLTISVEEAAPYFPCSPRWLTEQLRSGRLPGRKIGRNWRLTEDDIREGLDRLRKKTETENGYARADDAAEVVMSGVPPRRPTSTIRSTRSEHCGGGSAASAPSTPVGHLASTPLRSAQLHGLSAEAARLGLSESDDDAPPPYAGIDGAAVLDKVEAWYRCFIRVTFDREYHLLVLWTMHTHLAGASYATPRLQLDSLVRRAGKTTVLDRSRKRVVAG